MNFFGVSKALGLALALLGFFPSAAAEPVVAQVITKLDSLTTNLNAELTARLSTNVVRGSYTTVWRQFEDLAIEALKETLPRHIPRIDREELPRWWRGKHRPGEEPAG